jgi:hypothetical protein
MKLARMLMCLWIALLLDGAAVVRGQEEEPAEPAGEAPAETTAPPRAGCCRDLAVKVLDTQDAEDGEAPDGTQFVSTSTPPPTVVNNHGTNADSIQWIQDLERQHSGTNAELTYTFNANATQANIRRVADAVEAAGNDPVARVRALMDTARACYRHDESYVCRHHAILVYQAIQELENRALAGWRARQDSIGRPPPRPAPTYQVLLRCSGLTSSGHCWNHVIIGGRTFVVDAYNGILYEIRAGGV